MSNAQIHWYCVYHANNWIDICILLGFFGPFGPWVWGMYISLSLHWYCIYHANNWRGICILLGWHWYCICNAYEGREIIVFCLVYTDIVLYILHIIILYYYIISYIIIMLHNMFYIIYNISYFILCIIDIIFLICWVSLGPSGPGYGGVWISLSLHWYCLYHANN